MIIGLYLGSIAIASITTGVYAINFKKEIEKERFKIEKSKITLSSKIREGFCTLCGILIPGVNVIYTLLIIGLRKGLYEEMKNSFIKSEYIYKEGRDNRKNTTSEKRTITTRRAKRKKRYEEMTREEKRKLLQKELSNMIEEKTNKEENDGPKLQLKRTYNRK